jgi:hypothetical protein
MEQKTTLKEGKKPISSRRKPVETIAHDDVFSSALTLDPELSAELEAKGLVPRFVDAKRMGEMGGYNDKGWVVYKREKKASDTINPSDFKFGNDPSGIIRRGSLVLAVKTKEKADQHRRFLNQRSSQQQQINKQKADELRAFARQSGIVTEVFEGYEENEAPGI